MKKLTFLAMACSMFISVEAQTLKVNIGDVTYAFLHNRQATCCLSRTICLIYVGNRSQSAK